MKRNQVKVGMLVAVNDLPDGTVYTVETMCDFQVSLYYKSGGMKRAAGHSHVSVLTKPTRAQLEHALQIA